MWNAQMVLLVEERDRLVSQLNQAAISDAAKKSRLASDKAILEQNVERIEGDKSDLEARLTNLEMQILSSAQTDNFRDEHRPRIDHREEKRVTPGRLSTGAVYSYDAYESDGGCNGYDAPECWGSGQERGSWHVEERSNDGMSSGRERDSRGESNRRDLTGSNLDDGKVMSQRGQWHGPDIVVNSNGQGARSPRADVHRHEPPQWESGAAPIKPLGGIGAPGSPRHPEQARWEPVPQPASTWWERQPSSGAPSSPRRHEAGPHHSQPTGVFALAMRDRLPPMFVPLRREAERSNSTSSVTSSTQTLSTLDTDRSTTPLPLAELQQQREPPQQHPQQQREPPPPSPPPRTPKEHRAVRDSGQLAQRQHSRPRLSPSLRPSPHVLLTKVLKPTLKTRDVDDFEASSSMVSVASSSSSPLTSQDGLDARVQHWKARDLVLQDDCGEPTAQSSLPPLTFLPPTRPSGPFGPSCTSVGERRLSVHETPLPVPMSPPFPLQPREHESSGVDYINITATGLRIPMGRTPFCNP